MDEKDLDRELRSFVDRLTDEKPDSSPDCCIRSGPPNRGFTQRWCCSC
jgi:hypothetical protein